LILTLLVQARSDGFGAKGELSFGIANALQK
jgi:hypothetical protein